MPTPPSAPAADRRNARPGGFPGSKSGRAGAALWDVLVFPPDGSDAERRAEIDVIAERIGEAPETVCGHYVVWRFFGPVQYRAVAIPRDNDADGE